MANMLLRILLDCDELKFLRRKYQPIRMSALPSKADMCSAKCHVRFVPIADIIGLFDHFVSRQKNAIGYSDAKCFGRFEIDY